jgi:hypothetical protein
MSISEKIIAALGGMLLILMIIFSVHEIKEPPDTTETKNTSAFDESVGQDFKIGSFATVKNETSSGGLENDCEQLQPILVGALHDIKERLEHQKIYVGIEDAFEVNQATLTVLCNKNAEITLVDGSGNSLVLTKMPFTRVIPPGGRANDIGTNVRINATVIPAGGPAPKEPTTYGEVLIPDRYLDDATSSFR